MLFFRKPGAGPKKKDAKQQCHRVDVSVVEVVCGLYNPSIWKEKSKAGQSCTGEVLDGYQLSQVSCQYWEWQEDGGKHAWHGSEERTTVDVASMEIKTSWITAALVREMKGWKDMRLSSMSRAN